MSMEVVPSYSKEFGLLFFSCLILVKMVSVSLKTPVLKKYAHPSSPRATVVIRLVTMKVAFM